MFIRTVSSKTNGKIYRYPQLVESYRKPDGRPAHRVLCNLTSLSDLALSNLRSALEAGRKGKHVVLAPDTTQLLETVGIQANLRYLDVAVAFEQWNQLQLNTVLGKVIDATGGSSPPHSDMVCALVLHRCTAPGSKLSAARWYPKTALPELQGITPGRFHNTRVHRALDALEQVETELQRHLGHHLGSDHGAFATLFVDITDTWFEGRGPQMAYNSRTKEGMLRKKVGVLMLCDQRGYPIRWQTLPGHYYEADVMGEVVEQVSAHQWVQQVPLVLDRMMGKASALAHLTESGVRFVTALPVTEFESWTHDVPWHPLRDVSVAGTDASFKEDLARIRTALKQSTLTWVKSDRWVLDLGEVTRTLRQKDTSLQGGGPNAQALRLATAMKADLDAKVVRTHGALARRMDVTRQCISRYMKLLKLTPEIQRRIRQGEAESLSLVNLAAIAGQPAGRQRTAFNRLLKQKTRQRKPAKSSRLTGGPAAHASGVSIRLVVNFNPVLFVSKRRRASETLREVDAFVDDLNRRLRSPYSHRTETSIYAEVDRFLRAKHQVGLFKVTVDGPVNNLQVTLQLNTDEWAKRRRYDGFTLVAAHPDIPIPAADLVERYYAKDVVEKGFQTIKSELELRPVRHRTDPKVRAHVTLCMLALLIERGIEQRLKQVGMPMTASTLFDTLGSIHLNMVKTGRRSSYTVTECSPDESALVTALSMQHLVDDRLVSARIQPR